jgi:hypothetical protein
MITMGINITLNLAYYINREYYIFRHENELIVVFAV